MNNKIKCFELDFGDTNVIDKDIYQLLEWIKTDVENLKDGDEPLQYTISLKYLTQKELDNLPEWA